LANIIASGVVVFNGMADHDSLNLEAVGKIIAAAKKIAREYRRLTGRPIGLTGEVAEFEAARLLGLELAAVRQAGYDAIRRRGSAVQRLQVKGRCILSSNPGQRLGRIDLSKEWDGVLLVLLSPDLEPTAIYDADRRDIERALLAPGSKARNERGALSVSKFRSIGRKVWAADQRGMA
jgi:hypothetical protein